MTTKTLREVRHAVDKHGDFILDKDGNKKPAWRTVNVNTLPAALAAKYKKQAESYKVFIRDQQDFDTDLAVAYDAKFGGLPEGYMTVVGHKFGKLSIGDGLARVERQSKNAVSF